MSGTHAHTAEAQADLQRADAQGRKPHIPPGHVEAERPITRIPSRTVGWIVGTAAALLLVVVGLLFLVA